MRRMTDQPTTQKQEPDKSRWSFIENEGALFRGPARTLPKEVWGATGWEPYDGGPKDISWGTTITKEEFEALKSERR